MKIGDLVRVQGHENIAMFLEWCYDKDGFMHGGWASLLTGGTVQEVHVDFWFPVAPPEDSDASNR